MARSRFEIYLIGGLTDSPLHMEKLKIWTGKDTGAEDPDGASMVIIRGVWKELQKTDK